MDRFDLEQSIMATWSTCEDLDLIIENLLDGVEPLDTDDVANVLIGLRRLHSLRAGHAFSVYEQLVSAKQFVDTRETESSI